MPIVKHIAIHSTPKSMLEYVLRGDKTSDMKYASAINSVTDVERAYKMFEQSFEMCTGEKFYKRSGQKAFNMI